MIGTGNLNRQLTFEDLGGLRAEGYVRESTLDQRDGFGPEIQRNNILRFAKSYGLAMGTRWYTEFVSGRYSQNRSQFQHFLDDARMDLFDVLLVDHTSRFGRNQAECIRHKEEMWNLGKVVVFVSQGIISGSDRDFLSERIHETLDEQYSRSLSRYVTAGLAEKAGHGYAVGPPPLGYRSEILSGRKGERKVPDAQTMPALVLALEDYATGRFSFRDVADRLNAQGFRTRNERPFTGASIRDVLGNRFYEGKVIYHVGLPDEVVVDGAHEVPQEVEALWLKCQGIKARRRTTTAGHPRGPARHFPFSRVLTCHRCGSPYYGEAVRKNDQVDLRLSHERRGSGRLCDSRRRSRSVAALVNQMGERVMPYLKLDARWKSRVIAALGTREPEEHDQSQEKRLAQALENLRKQHLWGDISDEKYQCERQVMERQLKLVARPSEPPQLPNLERAAQLLEELPALWLHAGVTDEQREALVREVFHRITIDEKEFVSIEPQPAYVPLFATMLTGREFGYRVLKPPPSPPRTPERLGRAPKGMGITSPDTKKRQPSHQRPPV
ncbi:MAG: recombinase family protein [Chloroflexi bacterium]|nr:recombinase family protein [Chloroflexota bacterium]